MDRTRLSGMAAGASVLSAFTALCLPVGRAAAHEPPFGTGVYARGAQRVVRMSRGLVLQSADRDDYRLLCNEALGVAPYDTPSVLMRADGSLLVGTSTGLKHVSMDGCAIDRMPQLEDTQVYVLARDRGDPTRLFAATGAGFYESRDDGEHFAKRDEHVFDSLEVARDPEGTVFATGKLTSGRGPVRAYVARWRDADPLELSELPLAPNEYGVSLLGSDAEHIVAVAHAYLGTPDDDRFLVSSDRARSWHNPLSARHIAAFAIDAQSGAWLLGDGEGLWRTSSAGDSLAQLASAPVSCLTFATSELFMCDGEGPEGGVSSSADGGEHWRSVLRWNQVKGVPACSPGAPSVKLCQAAWEDWARELPPRHERPDAGLAEHTAESRSGDAAHCAAVRGRPPGRPGRKASRWVWLAPLWFLARSLQRLHRKESPS